MDATATSTRQRGPFRGQGRGPDIATLIRRAIDQSGGSPSAELARATLLALLVSDQLDGQAIAKAADTLAELLAAARRAADDGQSVGEGNHG
ncbi:MAG: hypothetical protein ABI673_02625 [Novosphingobium sp.]